MKSDFYIDKVGKEEVKELLYTYHYLKDQSKDLKSLIQMELHLNN